MPFTKVVKNAVLQDDCGIFLAWSFHGGSSPYQGIAKYWYHTGCRPVSYDQYISTKNCDVLNVEVTKSRPKQSNHGHVWYQVPGTPGTRYVIEGVVLVPWYHHDTTCTRHNDI